MLVGIIPVGEVPAKITRGASAGIRSVYDFDVTVREAQPLPSNAYDASRNQYDAEAFIELAELVGENEKNIAITTEDIYHQDRNFVFGLSYQDGTDAVVSTDRLRTQSNGGFSNQERFTIFDNRIRKEVNKQLGSLLGLDNCENKRCLMAFASTVRELDVQENTLCRSCQEMLNY